MSEIAAYEPSGAGDHVFVRLTKVQRTTLDVVSDLARALGCDSREAGYAGMKDKRAVATQTISLHVPRGAEAADLVARARAVAIDGVTILDAAAHGNKLKPGHLDGNAFDIVIRGLAVESAEPVFRELARIRGEGVPNAFGAQRFGSRRDDATTSLVPAPGCKGARPGRATDACSVSCGRRFSRPCSTPCLPRA